VIDPATRLIKTIEVVFDPKAGASAVPGESVKVERIAWNAGKVAPEVSKDDILAYKAPAGYGKVLPFERAAAGAGEVPKHRVEDLVGQPAPAFSLTVVGPAGKFQTITKDDLAGKVVMIDFWATWCGPCLAELPEVGKMIDAYAKDKKDVVIVALSEDDHPNELREVRKLVEKTLEEKHLTLSGNDVGKVALDPSGTVGGAFQVEAFPTVVLIDAKGTVQAAHVGFRPDVREVLTRDIDALLEGKSLARPKPKAND
jgi:thiol-disulfide isomerase/thioredoxin